MAEAVSVAAVKLFMVADSAAAASAMVANMRTARAEAESRKAPMEACTRKVRMEDRQLKARVGTEPLKAPREAKLPELPVGLMVKERMAAVIITETPNDH